MTDFTYKTILAGAAAVGKTSLVSQYVNGFFDFDYKLTIGVNILSKK